KQPSQAQTWGAQPQLQQQQPFQPTTLEEIQTLWIGDLQYWVNEAYLSGCFSHSGEVFSIKIIRNKVTGQPEGYGFIEFVSHGAAERVLQSYNGTQMPGTEQTFRLNWASFGIGERRPDAGPEHLIFVGDLAPDVTDYLLQETFRAQYPSVRGAKVVTDPNTGHSKGYGFVKFAEEMERNRAMRFQQPYTAAAVAVAPKPVYPTPAYTTPAVLPLPVPDNDITNTTLFIGGLDPNITDEELRQIFAQFGELVYVKIPSGKGCGFVQFGTRASAEEAIQRVHGTMVMMLMLLMEPPKILLYMRMVVHMMAMDNTLNRLKLLKKWEASFQLSNKGRNMLSPPDVDKLNDAYLLVHGRAMVGRPMWLKTSTLPVQA
ncbi:hypothetical protein GIB67_021876, partial [Kingdonia uniflora]